MKQVSVVGVALAALVGVSGCDEEEAPCEAGVGTACVWAGTARAGFNGDGEHRTESSLYWPVDVAFTSRGPHVLDWNNHKVRRLNDDETFETVIGSDFVGDGDPAMGDLVAPGVPGTSVALNHPTQILETPTGDLLLLAWHNHKLRHYDPDTGLVYVMCGRGAGFAGDGEGLTPDTRLNQPSAGVYAADGTLYILDQRNQRVRAIAPSGTIETVVGTGDPGFGGDGGSPLEAQLSLPTGSNPPPAGTLALDAEGRLYIADTLNNRVRRVDFAADTIETVAGNGTAAFAGDGGPAVEAALNNPRDLEIGPDGRLYIADERNNRIRAVDLQSGVIETVFGSGEPGEPGQLGDGLDPLDTALGQPAGIAFDDGFLYVSDTNNHVIRRARLD